MTVSINMTLDSIDAVTGGPARSVPNLARAISTVPGFVVKLYTGDPGENKAEFKVTEPLDIKHLEVSIKRDINDGAENIIIHNHGIWLPNNHKASVIARKNGIPMVVSPRGMLEPWARNYKKLKKTIAWILYQYRDLKNASTIHVTSQMEAENVLKYNIRRPISVIPNGVNVPPISNEQRKNEFGSGVALFLGRIHPKKGLINLVRAWKTVLPVDWKLIIAGPDEENHKMEVVDEINRLDLSKVISIKDQVSDDEKWKLYENSDLFILPSFSENFGIVVAEALACGVPVITTKGTPWEDLVNYQCGWWVEMNVDALSTVILDATSISTGQRRQMGENGRKLAIQKFSWEKIAEDMTKFYSWMLFGGTKPHFILLP